MSEFKLAGTLRIPVPEAKQLIADYFKAFPGIGKLLDILGRFGVEKGFIQTIFPLYRRRWFPNHKFYVRFIDAHIAKAQYHGGLGEIERASKNAPIQGSSADMMKVAVRDVYNHIHTHKLSDRVHMKMQVHDQLDCVVRDDFKEEWAKIQTQLMEAAAKVFIPSGILKAETTITPRWSK
jgi:DNA polymerase-1